MARDLSELRRDIDNIDEFTYTLIHSFPLRQRDEGGQIILESVQD